MISKIIIGIALIFSTARASAQDLNKDLFKAVMAKDTVTAAALLKKGADANATMLMGNGGWKMNMLVWATNNKSISMIKLLLLNGAKVDGRDQFNTTSLMYAAQAGNLELVKYLIAHGADAKASDGQGNTVLSAAKEGKDKAVITYINQILH